MDNKRKYVIPGDVVTTGPFRPEQNVILEGEKIISTTIGISEIYDDSVRVIPLTGKYIPKIDDLVIGKVIFPHFLVMGVGHQFMLCWIFACTGCFWTRFFCSC